jgi:hypothetical protein
VNGKAETAGQGTALAFLVIVITFGGLAWSLEIVGGWALLLVDLGLLVVLLPLTLALQRVLLGGPNWAVMRWWAVGALLTLAGDAAVAPAVPDDPLTIFGTLLARVVAYAILFAATVGASPWRILTRKGRQIDPDGWRRFLPALPLLVGTYAGYVAASVWYGLNERAIRSVAEATAVARSRGVAGQVSDLCVGAIRPEYFAQLSQVIPLLLVALGVERRFFEQLLKEPVQRALTIFTVLLLCTAEAVAIAVLVSPNQGCDKVLYYWQEYTAFLITALASFIALASLVWALVAVSPNEGDKPSVRAHDKLEDTQRSVRL